MLNTCASGVLICSTFSFSILGDIPSTPGDLFSFILLTSKIPVRWPGQCYGFTLSLIFKYCGGI